MKKDVKYVREKITTYRLKKELDFLRDDYCYYDQMHFLYKTLATAHKEKDYYQKWMIRMLITAALSFLIYFFINFSTCFMISFVILGMFLCVFLKYFIGIMKIDAIEQIIGYLEY